MSGNLSRTKGHAFERKIAEDFRDLGWTDCITTRASVGGNWCRSDNGIDLCSTEPFLVQCKRKRKYVNPSVIEEIGRDKDGNDVAPPEAIKILITKADGKPTMCVLPWDELKKLLAK